MTLSMPNSASDTYISPSDNLMSPATYKLCQLRQKNYTAKYVEPKLLSSPFCLVNTIDSENDNYAFSFLLNK